MEIAQTAGSERYAGDATNALMGCARAGLGNSGLGRCGSVQHRLSLRGTFSKPGGVHNSPSGLSHEKVTIPTSNAQNLSVTPSEHFPTGPSAVICVSAETMQTTLTIRQPDDWHLHLRDGAVLDAVLPETARHFARAIIMPNLVPPVVTGADAAAYRDRILAAKPDGSKFQPLMTLYLTEETQVRDLRAAAEIGLITAVKLYPAGATTNSASGVKDISKVMRVLENMAQIGLPLCVHGEVTDAEIDIFDREAVFIERVLDPVRREIPELKVIMEHVTTKDGVDYVKASDKNLGATITTHHLMLTRNDLLVGGIRPHYYCLPVLKRSTHRDALRAAATSGDARFFLGTDSAPHLDPLKENACGCAGVFSATNTLSCLAHVFEEEDALENLERFASLNGAAFYGLEPNTNMITLEKGAAVDYADKIDTADGPITVFDPGHELLWRVVS